MSIPLKQSTDSQEIPLGYMLDSTDGDTEETALTIANTDIKLWKQGATTLADKNSGGATHISNGIYYCTLDATDTNTLGSLIVFVHVSGALATRLECEVMTANRYDSLVAGTDVLHADLTQIGGVAQSATDLKDFSDAGYDPATHKVQGVVLADTTTTNTDMVGTDGANTVVPDAAGVAPTAVEIKTEVEQAGSSLATILADTNELQTDWVDGGRLDLLLDAIPTTAMRGTDGANTVVPDAAGTAAALHTTTDGKIDTVDGNVDAILVDTSTTLDGMMKRILGLDQENFYIDNTVFSGANMTSCRIRIYSVAGSVGTASDVIATYNMTTTYAGDNLASYKMVKA